jgi:Xaa-Pro aminopeptidase
MAQKNSSIAALRERLRLLGLYGCIIPSSYMLQQITGFSGSNGVAIVSQNELLFFTDGRYLLQAKRELPEEWGICSLACLSSISMEGKIGYDPDLWTKVQLSAFPCLDLTQAQLSNETNENFCSAIFSYQDYSGQNVEDKLLECDAWMRSKNLDFLFLSDAASVNWLLNFRAADLEYTPIALCVALVGFNQVHLFMHNSSRAAWLESGTIQVHELRTIQSFADSKASNRCGIDSASCTLGMRSKLSAMELVEVENPVLDKKCVKNSLELKFARERHIEDAIALIEGFAHIKHQADLGSTLYEHSIALILESYRKRSSAYLSASFATICGFKENSALVHYKPSSNGSKLVQGNGVLLIDSGANYLGATTDVTRNLVFGSVPNEVRLAYMQVLKGHLAIARAKFPLGTRGGQLDSLARSFLWNEGFDYMHATGHGVGNCLGVHEGPCGIYAGNSYILKEGMILSNEPGFYKAEEYGLRVENLCFVVPCQQGFLKLQQLTLVPYCRDLIDCTQLASEELSHINSYYQDISALVVPHLSNRAKEWCLKEMELR